MKQLVIEIEDYLYEFYKKIAVNAGIPIEKVVADSLFKFAGGLSEKMIATKKPPSQS